MVAHVAVRADRLRVEPMADESVNNPSAAGGQEESAAAKALRAAQEAILRARTMQSNPQAPAAVDVDEVVSAAPPAAAPRASAGVPSGAAPLTLPTFGAEPTEPLPAGMELLADVNLQVKIELGRTRMLLEDVLRLGDGTVVELDKLAGDPVDIYVNDRPVARGEVLVLNDNFCVRINEILSKDAIERAMPKGT
jgi:flagellar motor switch protein FliN